MSWKATAYVKELRRAPNGEPINKTEKLLLFVLADCHHVERKMAWPSLPNLAADALLSEREARYSLRELERKGVLRRIAMAKSGRGHIPAYQFLELPDAYSDQKGANLAPLQQKKTERVRAKERKGANPAPLFESNEEFAPDQKGGKIGLERGQEGGKNGSSHIEDARAELRTSKATEDLNITPGGVLRNHIEAWLAIKAKLKAELPLKEWKLWVRPALLQRMMGNTMLVALPPNGAIIAAAQSSLKRLRILGQLAGYCIVLTTYPDDWQKSELKRRHGIDLEARRKQCPPA